MSEQQAQKRGVVSEAQKQERAREGYEPLPASQPVQGAFGDPRPDRATDEDVSLKVDNRDKKPEQNED